MEAVARCTGATTGCGTCQHTVRRVIADHEGSAAPRHRLILAAGIA